MSSIEKSLVKHFKDQRVIFWYNEKEESHIQEEYDALKLKGIEKIHVQGNEFEVKHIVEKQFPDPKSKFLLYFTGAKPNHRENWLLDLELAHFIFHTDEDSLFVQEVGLDMHYKELVGEHKEFFKAKDRREKLNNFLGAGDSHHDIRYKMLAVTFGTEHISLETFVHAYGKAFITDKDQITKDLERYDLHDFFWKQIAGKYNYHSDSPTIYDFLVEIFSKVFLFGKKSELGKDSRLLLALWKDTHTYRPYFSDVSEKIGKDIGVESALQTATLDEAVKEEWFKLSDLKVINELVSLLIEDGISHEKVLTLVKQRENKFWYEEFKHFYAAIEHASEMMTLVRKYKNTKYDSFSEGTKHYTEELYRIDQTYRKFIWNYRKTIQSTAIALLAKRVEKVYSNDWLLRYNDNWQQVIDKLENFPTSAVDSQSRFFKTYVQPYLDKKQLLFVVISDALRYECGEELARYIQTKRSFDATVEPMVASLPSYTQLGMASLLPHEKLELKEGSDSILADGKSTKGTISRAKILAEKSGVRATAITAEKFMEKNSHVEGRDFAKQYDLVYVYHDQIDKTGDDTATEEKVFDAVESEIEELFNIVRKITNLNRTNILVTADHGFIYQNEKLDVSDFSATKFKGETWKEHRRFVFGTAIKTDASAKHFKGEQLGLNEGIDVMIPKSINRFRVKGAGSRFVHGGASLQELMIPVVRIRNNRTKTLSNVEVDIIKSTDKITTNILAVSFIQNDLVNEAVLPREVQAGIYSEDGELLSDLFHYTFDISEGSERQREVKHRFQLSSKASSKYKNTRVKLVLEEPMAGTNKWKVYKDYFYTLNISFTNDFDF